MWLKQNKNTFKKFPQNTQSKIRLLAKDQITED